MKLSKTTIIAAKIITHLQTTEPRLQSARTISEAIGAGFKHTEAVCSLLRAAHILETKKGSKGGYELIDNPNLCDIVEATEGIDFPTPLLQHTMERVLAIYDSRDIDGSRTL